MRGFERSKTAGGRASAQDEVVIKRSSYSQFERNSNMKQIFAIGTVVLAIAFSAAAQTPADKRVEVELLRIQREMIDTSLRGDKSEFERYTADTYIEIVFNVAVTTSARILDNFLTPPLIMMPALEILDVQVH